MLMEPYYTNYVGHIGHKYFSCSKTFAKLLIELLAIIEYYIISELFVE